MTTLVVEPHCKASEGGDCYRHGAGYFCTYCAYTVCEACYAAIQHKRKEPRRITGVTPTRDGALQHGEGELVTQCHLCRRGHLHQEDNMLFPWCCEGPYPASRVSRGGNAAYDTNSLQRYHTMKSQYSRRAASTAPLRASFHGIQEEEGEVRVVTDYRPACCPEGGRFLFSVDNPRLRETLVWAALSVDRRHAQPSVGLTTTIPLQVMRCPPTIRDLPPRRYVLSVPSGYYGTHGVHALMLFYRSDLFLRAEMQLSAVGGLSGHPSLPAIKPLLVVRLLHRLPIPRPVSKRAREDEATETSRKDVDCPELALCLDYLQHGKSVAVYGALSKYFFLEHVAHSTALLDYRVCVVDCSLGSVLRRERDVNNNSITSSGRGLSPCAKAHRG
ncbi:hypothetical protein AGDE_14430 [Angomonas deanei]|uniref:Uncharacterized protein n=1 Tax=Angomonas deanei TaxID=59799 RepID=A0A7G2CQG3_9TRYP|nr:hypothetical protein AGDE_14430 [Angomonas deanei]CAD2221214.1 hypothetical protein, conserved [Angomonas deanei]|eukprot:EPY20837.1 hypothetical protein AGDE_14430 [Angomonas deanei]